jgi:hypothetical protein
MKQVTAIFLATSAGLAASPDARKGVLTAQKK